MLECQPGQWGGGALDDDEHGEEPDALTGERQRRVKASSLLWFISSRPYVPMADIRRRFDLHTDDGAFLWDDEGPVHIGLPRQAAETLLDLKRKQKVGIEYDLEHAIRIAVGVFPLRIRLAPPPPRPVGPPRPAAPRPAPPPPEPPLDDHVIEPLESPLAEEQSAPRQPAPTGRSRRRRRRNR